MRGMSSISIFLAFVFFGNNTNLFAETTIKNKDAKILGTIDQDKLKDPEKRIELNPKTNSKIKVSVSCKDDTGMEYKNGQEGYDTCIAHTRTLYETNKKLNNGSNKDPKNSPNAGFSIKFGNE